MKMKPIVPKTAFGIAVGDIVKTSYGTGPYRVAYIRGPRRYDFDPLGIAVWPMPIINIVGVDPDWNMACVPQDHHCSWLSHIYHEDGRWLVIGGDEIYLTKPDDAPLLQGGLFPPETDDPEPYPFQDGVDYTLDGQIWHCDACGADFNATPEERQGKPGHCRPSVTPRRSIWPA